MAAPFDDPAYAQRYEEWYSSRGRRADRLEKRLFAHLIGSFRGAETLLEVGCGTGHFTRWFAGQGLRAVGLDISQAMLTTAAKRNGLAYVLGDACALPFPDQSFDIVALITALEFVPDWQRAVSEAVRVARRGLLLGALNRYSLLALRRKIRPKSPWDRARFFSPGEMAESLRNAAGTRLARIRWRTTLWPLPGLRSLPLPWGGFIGMAVQLRQG